MQMRSVVRDVALMFPTAIISGRGREKVESFVQLDELFYAGSHGMDIRGPHEAGHKVSDVVLHSWVPPERMLSPTGAGWSAVACSKECSHAALVARCMGWPRHPNSHAPTARRFARRSAGTQPI